MFNFPVACNRTVGGTVMAVGIIHFWQAHVLNLTSGISIKSTGALDFIIRIAHDRACGRAPHIFDTGLYWEAHVWHIASRRGIEGSGTEIFSFPVAFDWAVGRTVFTIEAF